MNKSPLICIPKKDTNKHFILGQKENHEMLAIGLNPSTSNEKKLDPTSRNIQSIALKNDYEGWWLINL